MDYATSKQAEGVRQTPKLHKGSAAFQPTLDVNDLTQPMICESPPTKKLRADSEMFEVQRNWSGLSGIKPREMGDCTVSSGISTKLGSPREELQGLDGFTIRVKGEVVYGIPEVNLDGSNPRNQYFSQSKQTAGPLGIDLAAPAFGDSHCVNNCR